MGGSRLFRKVASLDRPFQPINLDGFAAKSRDATLCPHEYRADGRKECTDVGCEEVKVTLASDK